MNNIVKSLCMIRRRYIVSICAMIILSLVMVFWEMILDIGVHGRLTLSTLDSTSLAAASSDTTFLSGLIPAVVIGYIYTARIQMYEIMAGYRPHQMILSRMLVLLPITLVSLAIIAVPYLITDRSAEMIRMLVLFCILCIRMTLCVIFLSPLTKNMAWIPLFSFFVQMFVQLYGSLEGFSESVFSFTCFGQCLLLSGNVTYDLMIKIIVSSVIACVIYYLVGYFTLKKKISLEPHPIS